MRRRSFFGGAFAGLGSAASAQPPRAKGSGIPIRTLGRTGEKLTLIGMGGARFHRVGMEEGRKVVRQAYELGINCFDLARSYWERQAEEVHGGVIAEFRKQVFLTSKSGVRTRAGAAAELEKSLRLVKTDYPDLWQIHGVNTKEDIQKVLAPGGARLQPEPLAQLFRVDEAPREKLQRHRAAQLRVFRFEDNPHAAAPQHRQHAEFSAGRAPGSGSPLSSRRTVRVALSSVEEAGAPHLLQNRESSEIGVWHRTQVILQPPAS